MVLSGRIRDQTPTYGSPAISGSGVADLDWSSCSMKRQQFSLCLAGADEPFVVIAPVVIARSDSDAAILFIPLLGIASSLPLLAMTTGLMLVCHRYSENCWLAVESLASGRKIQAHSGCRSNN